jgi:hypothetical protein
MMLSLGNLGGDEDACGEVNLGFDGKSAEPSLTLACPYGKLGDLNQFGFSLSDTSTCHSDEQDLLMQECSLSSDLFVAGGAEALHNYYENHCRGNSSCAIPTDQES